MKNIGKTQAKLWTVAVVKAAVVLVLLLCSVSAL